jgi:hypothetical protein
LRGEHEERIGQRERLVTQRDLALLHRLEQRALHLGRRAVDLVGQHEIRENRAVFGFEGAELRAINRRAHDVRRQHVGRELDAPEAATLNAAGQGLQRESLGQPGYALEQHVAASQERHQQAFEQTVLADDQPPQLEEDLLQLTSGGRRRWSISVAGREDGSGRVV